MKKTLLFLAILLICITGKAQTNMLNGHEYVDLGLSVKWATCNLGATSSEDFGTYMDYDKALTSCRDWDGSWRLPTKEEMEELCDLCSWTWTSQNGVDGFKVTGSNGNSIFLPAAGIRSMLFLLHDGHFGNYRSSTPGNHYDDGGYYLGFSPDGHYVSDGWRESGMSVRLVTK